MKTPPSPPIPIAVIGIGCRLSGDVADTEGLWRLLSTGQDTWSDVPSDRFAWESFDHASRQAPGSYRHRGGHFLAGDVAAFDADFFGISALEAQAMDPQHRHALEVAYEALENAGLRLEQLRGSDTGVFVATFTRDYENMLYKDPLSLPKYAMTGLGPAIASSRISYVFDLRGPSVTLDTGCSGSLVALHQACQSLQLGETTLALAGGTSLMLNPDTMVPMHQLHFLNPQGRSLAFDAEGSGYGRGEGVTMVVLKRLDDAMRDRDPIRGIIRGTAVGQDGRTQGITAPSMHAQRGLIESIYRSTGLATGGTAYVEAHGTGTVKGDVTEIEALHAAFCAGRTTSEPLHVGSIKANVGHTESASGLAGLIKAILVLEKGWIPPTPSVQHLRSQLVPYQSRIAISGTQMTPFPSHAIRRASVNSFAYGGTNAHVIVDGAPACSEASAVTKGVDSPNPPVPRLFVLSAHSRASLQAKMSRVQDWLREQGASLSLRDLAYTLVHRRSLLPWRFTWVGATPEEVSAGLQGGHSQDLTRSPRHSRLVFLFTGQGAQWYAMGRELLPVSTFHQSVQTSRVILTRLGARWDLLEELGRTKEASRLSDSTIGQPATTALQIALVQTLRHVGLQPAAVLGHSSGEIAAAYTVGAISHETALRVSYERGLVAQPSQSGTLTKGAMLAVGLGEEAVQPYLASVTTGLLVVACANSPTSVTVSGDVTAVEELQATLSTLEPPVPFTRLRVDTAYHSHHMQRVAGVYRCALGELPPVVPVHHPIPFFSSVTAQRKPHGFDAWYWVDNMVSKVDFHGALTALSQQLTVEMPDTHHHYLEIGPHGALSAYVHETLGLSDGQSHSYTPTLTRNRPADLSLLRAVGSVLEHGSCLDPTTAAPLHHSSDPVSPPDVLTNLPGYTWDHSRSYWAESRLSRRHRLRPHAYHDLCGLRCPDDTLLEPRFRHLLSTHSLPWLCDHRVDGAIIFPGAGYLAMALEAKRQVTQARCHPRPPSITRYLFRDVSFTKLLEIPPTGDEIELLLSFRNSDDPNADAGDPVTAWEEFRMSSVTSSGSATHHCRGWIRVEVLAPTEQQQQSDAMGETLTPLLTDGTLHPWNPQSLYAGLRSGGHYWGPSFARITRFRGHERAATGTIVIPHMAESMPDQHLQPHTIHPATLDAVIHSTLLLFSRACGRSVMFPVHVGALAVSAGIRRAPGEELEFGARIEPGAGRDQTEMAVVAWQRNADGEREVCLELRAGRLKGTAEKAEKAETDAAPSLCFEEIQWRCDVDVDSGALDRQPVGSGEEAAEEGAFGRLTRYLNARTQQMARAGVSSVTDDEVAPQHRRYFAWLKELAHRGAARPDIPAEPMDQPSGAEAQTLDLIQAHLRPLLLGETAAIALLLEHEDLLRRLYATDWSASRCYPQLHTYLSHLAFKRPGLRILEIGAGTGGATLPLLEALCPRPDTTSTAHPDAIASYHFTDISAGFFSQAQATLHPWQSILTYQTLDIGQDPLAQGFEPHAYDVVFAYNSLHVTDSVDMAIAHARRLLKPGGRLVLLEMTVLHDFVNAIYGLFPGWYRDRSDGRVAAPLLAVGEWQDRLHRGGFRGLPVVWHDFEGRDARRTSLLVATADGSGGSGGLAEVDSSRPVELAVVGGHLARVPGLELALRARGVRMNDPIPWEGYMGDATVATMLSDRGDTVVIAFSGDVVDGATAVDTMSFTIRGILLIVPPYPDRREGYRAPETVPGQSGHPTIPVLTLQLCGDISGHVAAIAQQAVDLMRSRFGESTMTTTESAAPDNFYVSTAGQILIPRLVPRQSLVQGTGSSDRPPASSRAVAGSGTTLQKTFLVRGKLDETTTRLVQYLNTRGVLEIVIHATQNIPDRLRQDFEGQLWIRGITGVHVLDVEPGTDGQELVRQLPSLQSSAVGCVLVGEDHQYVTALQPAVEVRTIIQLQDVVQLSGENLPLPLGNVISIYLPLDTATAALTSREFEALADYALTRQRSTIVVAGLNTRGPNDKNDAFWSHQSTAIAPTAKTDNDTAKPALPAVPVEEEIQDAKTPQDARRIAHHLVREFLSTLIALDPNAITAHASVEELGLDSFMVFRMRNWIFGTFKATLKPKEISDSANVDRLVSTILERTRFRDWEAGKEQKEELASAATVIAPHARSESLPRQPLPALSTSLDGYLAAVESFCTPAELARTRAEIAHFQSPEGLGVELQRRLQAQAHSRPTDSWLADLYMERRFLALRSSLVGYQTYFGTHPPGGPVSPAEKAALLTWTTGQFQRQLESGELETQYVSGQAVDPESYHWQFNACRVPQKGLDRIEKYSFAEHSHIAVFRRGHAFAVPLVDGDGFLPVEALQARFQTILDLPLEASALSLLTADGREQWAEHRSQLLQSGEHNAASIRLIEAAAFIVCLDETSPETPSARFRQFLLADSGNRWFDKTLQIVVCPNGTSASVMEHSHLDGLSVGPLHAALNRAIDTYQPRPSRPSPLPADSITPLPITLPSHIASYLPTLSQALQIRFASTTFASLTLCDTLLPAFCNAHRLPFQGTLQLAFQLAARRFYGYTPPATETVSMSHFRHGRVDVNAIIHPKMLHFLDVASSSFAPSASSTSSSPISASPTSSSSSAQLRSPPDSQHHPLDRAELRRHALAATKEHTLHLNRVCHGRGYNRHLLALEWMLSPEEDRPTFFQDPSYRKSQPGRVLTSSFATGWLEGGFVYPPAESILVYWEVLEEEARLRFSIFGNGVDAEGYGRCLEDAAREVQAILCEAPTSHALHMTSPR
ncbi:uncharacterized protein BO80DRAFT_244580 [Aspergillus ibericus CBS 121593]|uniref:Uncharacterized protein n=1 Tax=Aspergillus ibericus CBS 121593 TaxID=1448316 RepID=A0A395GKD6_9EURO|nr:hypothetical protein BO80DRAFT_244580 [Aspergillus ibericus CBS 121593]RAK95950.1 hypothetical protein BO80DRAFT_244580 [Aspergillus ibericus CBS 121593]